MKKRIQRNRPRARVVELNPLYKLTAELTGYSAKKIKEIIGEHFELLREWTYNPILHKAFVLPNLGRFEIKRHHLDKIVDVIIPKVIEKTEDEVPIHIERLLYFERVRKQQEEYNSRFDDRTEKFRTWLESQKETHE